MLYVSTSKGKKLENLRILKALKALRASKGWKDSKGYKKVLNNAKKCKIIISSFSH